MAKYLFVFFLLNCCLCKANMASPLQEGTYAISAISSSDMDILNEDIFIKINRFFKTASYQVEYTIRNKKEGLQIPLLFHARDYLGHFNVWLDGKQVNLKEIPDGLKVTRFNSFSKSLEHAGGNPGYSILIKDTYHSGRYFPLSDFRYFEVDLKPGKHRIRLEYVGKVWTDDDDWTKEYSFRYFLSPAREWRSFRSLNIRIDASSFEKPLLSNLGTPDSGNIQSIASWHFSEIPSDYITISYQPPLNKSAKLLIAITPWGITGIFGLLVLLTHSLLLRYTQKQQWDRLTAVLLVSGSLILPFIILITYGYSYDLIDWVIGPHAGKYHGYTFFSVLLYILLMPAYWLTLYYIRAHFKKRFAAKKTNQ